MHKNFKSCVALVTPFDENGVDFQTLGKLIDFQLSNGTDAILMLGTTGEASTMTQEEKNETIKYAKLKINNRVPLIVGAGSNDTKIALNNSINAQSLGADAVLVVTPYYNKCMQSGLIAHYEYIANNIDIPIIAYNVPSRTGVNIMPDTMVKLAKIKNIIGIKEASGNISQAIEIISKIPKKFHVYCGDDLLNYPMMCIGAKGVISVTANAFPQLISAMVTYCTKNDFQNAKALHEKLIDINKKLFLEVNPIPIKYAMNYLGFSVGKPRLPLLKISANNAKVLIKTMQKTQDYTKKRFK